MCIHYNTKAFEDAGIERPKDDWTWDDFHGHRPKTDQRRSRKQKLRIWACHSSISVCNLGLTPTAPLCSTPDWKKSNLDDPKALESVKFIHSLVNEHKVAPSVEGTGGNAIFAMFAGGKIAMTGGGHWPLGTYLANNFKTMDVQNWPQKNGRNAPSSDRAAGESADTAKIPNSPGN